MYCSGEGYWYSFKRRCLLRWWSSYGGGGGVFSWLEAMCLVLLRIGVEVCCGGGELG